MKYLFAILLILVVISFARTMFMSFRAQQLSDYADMGPAFDLKTHLAGDILSEGLIYGPTGKMTNSFVAKMKGVWDGNTGTLTENFTYSNGRDQTREWTITLDEGGKTFTATADDIVGLAHGEVSGAALKMTYRLILPKEAGGQKLDVVDWLYVTRDGVVMNRSELHKFGLRVAELVAVMRPAP